MAKILRIFKKIKSLSAYAPAIKNFGKNFIFPFTPPTLLAKIFAFFKLFQNFSHFGMLFGHVQNLPGERPKDNAKKTVD
ncbi:MAG: hypothetical protein PVH77_02125 [Phycisphaerales bacterium]